MTLVNGQSTVRRIAAPSTEARTPTTGAAQGTGPVDQFETPPTAPRGEAPNVSRGDASHNGASIIRGDNGQHSTIGSVVGGVKHALDTVKEQFAKPKVDPNTVVKSGDAMSKQDATAAVIDIYSKAFPGISFTEGELSKAISMLQHGSTTISEMTTRVQEGAKLVNDPNAMADQVYYAPSAAPDQHSSLTQKLRMDRLATLMEAGYLPEGKFNIIGGFAFHSFSAMNGSRFYSSYGAQTAASPKSTVPTTSPRGMTGMTRDMARSLERYKTNAKESGSDVNDEDGKSGSKPRGTGSTSKSLGKTLIKGKPTNDANSNSMTFSGERSTHQVALTSADVNSLREASSDLAKSSGLQMSPVMLDLNHDGKLGTTGVSTAKSRIDNDVNATVDFDLDGDGKKEHVEWMNGDGDGMLVDDRDGGATEAMHGDGEIDGKRLFGDEGGKYANGYEKMKALDTNDDGKLSGSELDGLKTWIDDGDAKIEEGELKTLAELGVTEIGLKMELTANDRGEALMRSTFTQNGEQHISEDVWFGVDQEHSVSNLAHVAATVAERASPHGRAAMIARLDTAMRDIADVARDVERRGHANDMARHSNLVLLTTGFRA